MSARDKVALVTGASMGLGKAFSEILLQNGAKVGILDINADQGAKTLAEFASAYGQNKVMFLKCDVTNPQEVGDTFKAVKERFGGLDIVINNAGVGFEKEHWEATININVIGTVQGCMVAMDLMRKDRGGRGGVIVNVASMAGITPNPCGPVYGASKAAIIMYTLSWAANPELLANGVRMNVLAPAFADTKLVSKLTDEPDGIFLPSVAQEIIKNAGIMRPEAVAEAMFELVDDQNKTGAILKIAEATGKAYHTTPLQ